MGLPGMRSRLLSRVLAEPVPEAELSGAILLTEAVVDRLLAASVSAVRVRSPLTCNAPVGLCQRCYGADLATGKLVRPGTAVGIIAAQSVGEPGTQLTMRTFHSGGIAGAQGDITQGLPRVEDLFNVRSPRNKAILSEIDGIIQVAQDDATGHRGVRVVNPQGGEERSYSFATGQHLLVASGHSVTAGSPLCTGVPDPRDLLSTRGREATASYLVSEVQKVYRTTGVYLHDKHLECLVRQMLRFVRVVESGDTELLPGQIVDRGVAAQSIAATLAQGGSPALAHPIVLGLSQVALQTQSWIAAASFQETSRVLAKAALGGQHDHLVGFKERIVVGRRIPTDLAEESPEQAATSRLRPLVIRGSGQSGRERERERS